MLPSLHALSLDAAVAARRASATGEFFPLSRSKVNKLNRNGNVEPITTEPFRKDNEPVEGWHTFRVRIEQPDGTFKDQFYRAESLWQHYNSEEEVFDPVTRQRVWYEDWWALHDRFNPDGRIYEWVLSLPRLEPGTPAPAPAPAPAPGDWETPPPASAPAPAPGDWDAPPPPVRQNPWLARVGRLMERPRGARLTPPSDWV